MGLNSLHNFTPQDGIFVANLMRGFTLPGTGLSVIVLAAFAVVAWNPVSRPHLDRVSLRLLTYAIIANILFGISTVVDTSLYGPSAGCTFVAFLTNISLIFSALQLFCIALNLQLVLVHGLNGNKMEKWYMIGSTVVACALNVPVYALNQFGWNENNSTCWFSNSDDKIRLRWTIGTQSFWVLLIASGETVMCMVVIWYILWCDRANRNMVQHASAAATGSKSKIPSMVSQDPITQGYATRYRNIILRIGLYPVVSCILNYTTVALDLYQTIDGVNTNLQYGMNLLDLCLYGSRPFFYAALGATDPSFLRGVRALRKSGNTLVGSTELSEFHAATRSSGVLSNPQESGGRVSGGGGLLAVPLRLDQTQQTSTSVTADGRDIELGKKEMTDSSSCDEPGRDQKIDTAKGKTETETGTGLGIAARAGAARGAHAEDDGEAERASRAFTRQI